MDYETGTIKGNKSTYFNKSENKEITKYSKTINLGVNSNFNIGDKVIVISKQDYENLINIKHDDIKQVETITDLNKQVHDKDNIINTLTNELKSITDNYNDSLIEIAKLTNKLKTNELELSTLLTVMKQYNINSSDELSILFTDIRVALNYLSDCIVAYESQSIIRKLLNKNPTTDIQKPTLRLIDYKGNINTNDKIIDSKTK